MKSALTTLLFFSVLAVSATATLAQGRHDEKPHGLNKSASTAPDRSARATGGRHDEGGTTHGPKKKSRAGEKDKAATDAAAKEK